MEVKKIVEGMTAPQVAQVIDDNFKAQNAILEEDIAKQNNVIGVSEYKDFSEAEAVNVGDVRKYNGFLYECVEATTGAFDASKWKKSSFKAETEKKLSELGSEVSNPEYVRAYTDSGGRFLWGIKQDGSIEWAKGVPTPVKEYIESLDLENDEEVERINKLVIGLLADVKVLSETYRYISNSEWACAVVDANDHILFGIKAESGEPYYPNNAMFESFNDLEERLAIVQDNNGLIVEYTDRKGKKHLSQPTNQDSILQEEINKSNKRINGTESIVAESNINRNDITRYGIPQYYFENDYIDTKVAQINSELESCVNNGGAFIFITDTHWETSFNQRNSPSLIRYIKEKTNIDTILHGGDLYGESKNNDNNLNMLLHRAVNNGRVYYSNGNHEFISGNDYNFAFAKTGLMNHDAVYGGNNHLYYYVDAPECKLRYISLASYGKLENGRYALPLNEEDSLFEAQFEWFKKTALNVEKGWTIVVFTHVLYNVYSGTPDDYTVNAPISLYTGKKYVDLIDQYMGYTPNDPNDVIGGLVGQGEIACVLLGHAHRDRMHYSAAGVPYIITTSDQNGLSKTGYDVADMLDSERPNGSIYEQAFDVVVINKSEHKIKLIRVGAKARNGFDNNLGELSEHREVTYPNR